MNRNEMDRRDPELWKMRLVVDITTFLMWAAAGLLVMLFWGCVLGALVKFFWLDWVLR